MSILEMLKKPQSKAQCDRIVSFIGCDQEKFDDLVILFLTGDHHITQRSSRPLMLAVEAHPALVTPHLKKILVNLKKPGLHDAVKRNTMRFLQLIDIPPSLHGLTIDRAFKLFQDKQESIAARVFAMTVLSHMAEFHPALKNEIAVMIEDEIPFASPAFVSRGSKVLKRLKA